jgi:hypothetical protein
VMLKVRNAVRRLEGNTVFMMQPTIDSEFILG